MPEDTKEAQDGSADRTEASTEDFTHYVHLADGSVERVTEVPDGSHLPVEGEDVHGGRFIIGIYPR